MRSPNVGDSYPTVSSDEEGNDITSVTTSQQTMTILEQILTEIKNLSEKNTELLVSVYFCSDKISHFESVVKEKIENLEKNTREKSSLKKEDYFFNNRAESLEQKLRY